MHHEYGVMRLDGSNVEAADLIRLLSCYLLRFPSMSRDVIDRLQIWQCIDYRSFREVYISLDLGLESLSSVHLLNCCLTRLQTLLPSREALAVP
jgi:hypothetical protein